MTVIETITVPRHLRGYPGVAFGGCIAGMLAGRLAAKTVRVDFRRPTPVDVPVGLTDTADGGAVLTGADGVLAVATPDELALEVPDPPSRDEASAAAEAYRAAPPERAADCFGCGLDRTPDTGLRQHCAAVPGRDLVATALTAGPALADTEGKLRAELVWGALDCPGNAAGRLREGAAGGGSDGLTHGTAAPAGAGLLTAGVICLGPLGERAEAPGGVALATAGGDLGAIASALWVDPR
ncbi:MULTISPECIES: hypothetical protein [Streptomyces]|uniref:hypothetical protein n=1 Tax=Streptomyces TaxID=1883 RepID=UPI000A5FF6D6|nr:MULTISPECIES: hypothetical protein [Streptomyces]